MWFSKKPEEKIAMQSPYRELPKKVDQAAKEKKKINVKRLIIKYKFSIPNSNEVKVIESTVDGSAGWSSHSSDFININFARSRYQAKLVYFHNMGAFILDDITIPYSRFIEAEHTEEDFFIEEP